VTFVSLQGHDNGMSGGELPAVGWFKDVYDRLCLGCETRRWTEDTRKGEGGSERKAETAQNDNQGTQRRNGRGSFR